MAASVGCLAPALDRHLAVAGIDADSDAIRVKLRTPRAPGPGSRSATVPRMTRSHALVEPHGDGGRDRGCRRQAERGSTTRARIVFDRRGIDRASGKGAVEIDEMQPVKPWRSKRRACAAGSVIEDGGRLHVAALAGARIGRLSDRWRETGSWPPAQEIGDQREAQRLALLGVELDARDIVARRPWRSRHRHDRSSAMTSLAVSRHANDRNGRNRREVPPRRLECLQAAHAAFSRSSVFQPICGILSDGSRGAIATTSPAIQPKPSRLAMFEAALGHELHADANAEKGLAARDDFFLKRLPHAGHDRLEPVAAIRKAPTPGSTMRSASRTQSGSDDDADLGRDSPDRARRARRPWRRSEDCRSRNR